MILIRKEQFLQSTSACSLNLHTETCLIVTTFLLKLCGSNFSLDKNSAEDSVSASQPQVSQIDFELRLLPAHSFVCSSTLGFLQVLWFPLNSQKHAKRETDACELLRGLSGCVIVCMRGLLQYSLLQGALVIL